MSSGCRVTAARQAKRRDFIKNMSSKTILIGLGILRCGANCAVREVGEQGL